MVAVGVIVDNGWTYDDLPRTNRENSRLRFIQLPRTGGKVQIQCVNPPSLADWMIEKFKIPTYPASSTLLEVFDMFTLEDPIIPSRKPIEGIE